MKKQVDELDLERAKNLLGQGEIDEVKLKKLLERIKVFCKVTYQLYLKKVESDKSTDITKELKS
jgi:hypothetical protein